MDPSFHPLSRTLIYLSSSPECLLSSPTRSPHQILSGLPFIVAQGKVLILYQSGPHNIRIYFGNKVATLDTHSLICLIHSGKVELELWRNRTPDRGWLLRLLSVHVVGTSWTRSTTTLCPSLGQQTTRGNVHPQNCCLTLGQSFATNSAIPNQ